MGVRQEGGEPVVWRVCMQHLVHGRRGLWVAVRLVICKRIAQHIQDGAFVILLCRPEGSGVRH